MTANAMTHQWKSASEWRLRDSRGNSFPFRLLSLSIHVLLFLVRHEKHTNTGDFRSIFPSEIRLSRKHRWDGHVISEKSRQVKRKERPPLKESKRERSYSCISSFTSSHNDFDLWFRGWGSSEGLFSSRLHCTSKRLLLLHRDSPTVPFLDMWCVALFASSLPIHSANPILGHLFSFSWMSCEWLHVLWLRRQEHPSTWMLNKSEKQKLLLVSHVHRFSWFSVRQSCKKSVTLRTTSILLSVFIEKSVSSQGLLNRSLSLPEIDLLLDRNQWRTRNSDSLSIGSMSLTVIVGSNPSEKEISWKDFSSSNASVRMTNLEWIRSIDILWLSIRVKKRILYGKHTTSTFSLWILLYILHNCCVYKNRRYRRK